jgi:hypothetical protein
MPTPLPLVELLQTLLYFDRAAYSMLTSDHTDANQTMVDSNMQFTFLLGDAYVALKWSSRARRARSSARLAFWGTLTLLESRSTRTLDFTHG